jgi:hypothetical protein
MTSRLWASELLAQESVMHAGEAIEKGLRPPLQSLNPSSRELLQHCFGADTRPEMRYSFADIARLIEGRPSEYFPHADISAFWKYERFLNETPVEPMDENLMYLLQQLTSMISISRRLDDLPRGSPFSDKILFCLGRMFGDENEQNPEVVLIARYQFATKGCLDGAEFLRELDAFQTFPPGRPNFSLGAFLIDPDQPISPNRRRTLLHIASQNELFRALRTILAGICCEHPCVLKVHGWNVMRQDGALSLFIDTDDAEPLSIEGFKDWSAPDQSKFLLSIAMGMLEIHSRGVLHNNLTDAVSIQIKNGRAQICNFGLLDEHASFAADTAACQALFSHAQDEAFHLSRQLNEGNSSSHQRTFQDYITTALECERELEESPSRSDPLRECYDQIKNEATAASFPFDLFFHLVHCSEFWRSRDEPLDVGAALAQLTCGLDEPGTEGFKAAVNESLAAYGFLRPDFCTSS